MRKGTKKCGNCYNFQKLRNNTYSLCMAYDTRANSGDSGVKCKYYDRLTKNNR